MRHHRDKTHFLIVFYSPVVEELASFSLCLKIALYFSLSHECGVNVSKKLVNAQRLWGPTRPSSSRFSASWLSHLLLSFRSFLSLYGTSLVPVASQKSSIKGRRPWVAYFALSVPSGPESLEKQLRYARYPTSLTDFGHHLVIEDLPGQADTSLSSGVRIEPVPFHGYLVPSLAFLPTNHPITEGCRCFRFLSTPLSILTSGLAVHRATQLACSLPRLARVTRLRAFS